MNSLKYFFICEAKKLCFICEAKKLCFIGAICLFSFIFFPKEVLAVGNSFATVVNPIRGEDFWEVMDQKPGDAVLEQAKILKELQIPATWLIRYDALINLEIQKILLSVFPGNEKGLFLEVTPTWTMASGVEYQKSDVWHQAGSVFLTGYAQSDRKKLIDIAFEDFKKNFGAYPKSVGAWWIDSYSLEYMQDKYNVTAALIVADQYTTDNYQIWGQYWSTPYFPSKKNTLLPAQNIENKIPVVMMQWAARDPVNAYGDGVQESTYSVQPNDYIDYHKLDINYFSKLVDIYTSQPLNQFGHIVVGLENSYSWNDYRDEYRRQAAVLKERQTSGKLAFLTMEDFAQWYSFKFPKISPEHILVADDPLGTYKKAVWFMNPYFRAGWFYNKDGSVFRDIRQYVEGQIEPCFDKPCQQINFATFSTRVLDDATYKQQFILDKGQVNEVGVVKKGDNYLLSYKNEIGRGRIIEFMPRDISIDGKIKTIDGLILDTVSQLRKETISQETQSFTSSAVLKQSLVGFLLKTAQFLAFVILVLFIPGFLLVKFLRQQSLLFHIFTSLCLGLVLLTLTAFVTGYLKIGWITMPLVFIALLYFLFKKIYREIGLYQLMHQSFSSAAPLIIITLAGTFFQALAMIRSGWVYDFGMGFWGPTGHDGIWHQALINQIMQNIPPINPAFSGSLLLNYHYFFDLLVASTARLSFVPPIDLLYRFYPVLFSLLLGIGTYLIITRVFSGITNQKSVVLLALFFVYFGSSFGWIIDFLKGREWGGESAFWVNQPVSMNLNPPFAISLILIIAIILVFQIGLIKRNLISTVVLVLLIGSLLEFKVYAGVIVLGGLTLVSIKELLTKKDIWPLKVLLGSSALAALVFWPTNFQAPNLLIFSPFWFIHSMIDFSDRVGWERLSTARVAYLNRGEWHKFILAEGLGFLLFVIGNLGTRFIFLFNPPLLFKKIFKEGSMFMIFSTLIISIFIPLFFIQKGNDWNTIQFFYYALYVSALFSAVTLVAVYARLKSISSVTGLIVVGVVIVITPISSFTTFKNGFYNTPPSRLPQGEIEALNFLKNLPYGNVLTYPFDKNLRVHFKEPYPLDVYETTSYVSAFSGKSTFLEDEIQQEILQNDYKKRLVSENEFFSCKDKNWMSDFVKERNIRYIYLVRREDFSLGCFSDRLEEVFENEEVLIYQVLRF